MKLYLFRTVPLSIIRSFSLYTQQCYMLYGFADSLLASKPVWHIPLLRVQWKTADDGQRNCSKHVDFHSKNKFEKLVHPVDFIIRNIFLFLLLVYCSNQFCNILRCFIIHSFLTEQQTQQTRVFLEKLMVLGEEVYPIHTAFIYFESKLCFIYYPKNNWWSSISKGIVTKIANTRRNNLLKQIDLPKIVVFWAFLGITLRRRLGSSETSQQSTNDTQRHIPKSKIYSSIHCAVRGSQNAKQLLETWKGKWLWQCYK